MLSRFTSFAAFKFIMSFISFHAVHASLQLLAACFMQEEKGDLSIMKLCKDSSHGQVSVLVGFTTVGHLPKHATSCA